MKKEKTCPVCGELFQIPPTQPKKKYCGIKCSVIGRRMTKEESADKRVNDFIESLPDLPIVDALEGKFNPGGSTNTVYINAKGVLAYPEKRYIVLVLER